MMPIELVRSTALTDTVPYAYAAVTPSGRLVFTAGACPLDHDGTVVSPGDVAAQAKQVMANLAMALGAAGAGLTDVAKTTVYVASGSRTDLLTAWQVVRDAFGDHDAPSTLLGVAVLGYPDQLVEVEAVRSPAAGRGHERVQVRRSLCSITRELRLPTDPGREENANVPKPLRCRLRFHAWEDRENPETGDRYQVCVRCNAYRDRGSAAPGAGAAGVTGTDLG